MDRRMFCMAMLITVLISTRLVSLTSVAESKCWGSRRNMLLNINNIYMWVRDDGLLGTNPGDFPGGTIYPRGTAEVLRREGVLWGGVVHDGKSVHYVGRNYYNTGDYLIRVGGSTEYNVLSPGRIVSKGVAEDPSASDVRIWRIRRDWESADLTQEAAEFFGDPVDSVTQERIADLRALYEQDWTEWPWQKGAPFYDTNGNGMMDEGEEPGLLDADQVVGFVASDLDSSKTVDLYGSPPIGMEMQVTLWAYDKTGSQIAEALQNTVFKKIRLIYKGRTDTPETAYIDSMFVAQKVEAKLGDCRDDFVGCDTLLDLGFVYNADASDQEFGDASPPAFGFALVQGPNVGEECLPMTSFWCFGWGDVNVMPTVKHYIGTLEMYTYFNGIYPYFGTPFSDPDDHPTRYLCSGDPVAGSGFVDGVLLAPGERLFMMSSGPFTMALGDTQEVIFAIVGGQGSDHLESVSVMKDHVHEVQTFVDNSFMEGFTRVADSDPIRIPQDFCLHQNYPNPFNPTTTIRFRLPRAGFVTLRIYDLLGKEIQTLLNEQRPAGEYAVTWKAEDLSSGIYVCRLEVGGFVDTRKLVLQR